jgi:3-methyladenine DNA glycosylase/8-oxoguanine DNA glycosylase
VLDGAIAGLELEHAGLGAQQLLNKLLPLSGMGPFTAANVLQLLGHFDLIPADTETMRHLKQHHKPANLTPKTLQEIAQKVGATLNP